MGSEMEINARRIPYSAEGVKFLLFPLTVFYSRQNVAHMRSSEEFEMSPSMAFVGNLSGDEFWGPKSFRVACLIVLG